MMSPIIQLIPNRIPILFSSIVLTLFLLLSQFTNAQQLAFPSAEGAGASATGGRGGTVLHVTTLDWNDTEGSFKWALEQTYPRIIVFDVSGTIKVTGLYALDGQQYKDLTIAGQSAPEGGITVEFYWFKIQDVDNVIMRYIRFVNKSFFRPGGTINSAFSFGASKYSILDHVSSRYSWNSVGVGLRNDSGGTGLGFTVQNSIFGDCKTGMIVGPDVGDAVGVANGADYSVHHNLFAHISHRFPNATGDGNFEIINNITYNSSARLNQIFNSPNVNMIGNYFRDGEKFDLSVNKVATYYGQGALTPQIYTDNNIVEFTGYTKTDTGWDGLFVEWADTNGNDAIPANESTFRSFTKFADINPNAPVTIEDVDDAYLSVLADVGANKYLNADGTYGIYLDSVDESYINETLTRTGTSKNLTNSNELTYPALPNNVRPTGFYNNNKSADIPEEWYDLYVTNGDSASDFAPSGYTWIEEYLNGVDSDYVPVNKPQIIRTDSNPTTIEVNGNYTAPEGTWTDVEDGSGIATVGGDVVDTTTVGTYSVTLSHTDTDGNTGSITIIYNIVAELILATEVTVSPSIASIQIGDTIPLSAVVNGETGNATDQSGVWTVSNDNCSVNSDTGVVTGAAVGSSVITFTSTDGEFSSTSTITVIANIASTPIVFLEGESTNPNYFLVNENTVNPIATLITPNQDVNATYTYTIPTPNVYDYERFSIVNGNQLQLNLTPDFENPVDTAGNNIYFLSVRATSNLGVVSNGNVLFWVQDIEDETPVSVSGVSVSPSIVDLQIPENISLTATFNPIDATNQNGVWSSSDQSIAVVDSNGVVTPVSVGTTTITYTTSEGGFTDISEITVFPEALLVSAGNDQQICEGESVTLTASGGTNYIWFNGETTESIEVSPTETTTYTVTVSDDYGQSEEAIVTVTVNAIPVTDISEDQTICDGQSVTLTASGGTTYLWNTGETTASIEVSPQSDTTYSVDIISNNCSSTDEVTVFVNELPNIEVIQEIVIVEGESVTITASGSDNYEWSTGETTASITVTPLVTTTYIVSTTSIAGCTNASNMIVTVVPEVIANAGEDVTICSGDSITLSATGGSTYLWDTGEAQTSIEVSPITNTTYTVTVEDDFGFADTDTVTVYVNELPNITVSEDVYVMIGNSATLTANGGNSYLWNTGETTSQITVSPNLTATYSVTGFSDNGCQNTAEVIVTVVEELNANAGEDVSICIGETITLGASGGVTYTWNTGDTGTSPTFAPTETTTYTVTTTDGFGNSDSDDVTITVNPLPTANAGGDQTICNGESVTLTAEGGDSYLWNTGATTASITVSPNEDITYNVEVTTNGCSDTDEVTVIVMPTPEIVISDDIVLVTGNSATLEVSGGDSYLWNTGDTSDTISVNPTVTTTYSVTAFLANGCESTSEVTITVIPEVIADAGEDVSICLGETITLSASGGSMYTWNTGDTGTSPTFTPLETTTYTVTVTDDFGNSDSDNVTVTVNALPNLTLSDNITIFEGESTNLVADGSETYFWSTGETSNSILVNPIVTTTYSVTGFSTNGCETTADVVVTVIPELFANAGNDVSICIGDSVTLNASGGLVYTWNTGDTGTSPTFTPLETTTYTVTVTDDFGNSDSDSVTVTVNELPNLTVSENITIFQSEGANLVANGSETYLWSTGQTSNSIVVNPNVTTTYSVTGFSINGCETTAEIVVTVIPELIANAGNDVTICIGDSVTLNATGGVSYIWNTGDTGASPTFTPLETTTYIVTITDDFGNYDSDSVEVTVTELPNLTVSDNITIYEGESTNLIANGSEIYLWNTGETSNSIVVNPNVTTTYSVTGFSISGCEITAEVVVTVIPEVIANAGDDVSICIGESVTLNASGGESYIWNTGDTGASPTFNPSVTTTYTVTVSDNLGNSDTDSVTVTVGEFPNLIVSENVTIFEGESINLVVNGAETYLWSTGDSSNSITVSPDVTTTYLVTGFSINGCETTAEIVVTVIPEVNANAGNDVAICLGESVTLNASGGVSYLWNTGDTGTSPTFTPTETTTYTVTVSDNLGNSDTDSVTVTVNEIPVISVSENITIIEGETTSLSVNGAASFLWSTGETSNSITVSPTVTTTYTVIGTTNSCSSEQAQVTVTVSPLFVASAGADEHVCNNQTYNVVLTATQGDSYVWSTGETTQSITVSPLSTTSYTVTVTSNGQVDTDDVTVYVNLSPDVVIANGDSIDILNGDFVTLSASGANTYEWNNGATQPNIAVSPTTTTTYEVRGFIGDCYDDKQVTVNVLESVNANAGEDVLICLDEVTTLTATGGDEYVWSTGETTQSIQVSPEETTDYTVTVFNSIDFDEATVTVEVDANCNEQIEDPITGIPKDFKFNVYPNPASNVVNIKFSGVLIASDVHIYDVTGKLIQRTQVSNENISTSTTIQVDISSLQSGIYFVKLIGEEKDITEKLIVQ